MNSRICIASLGPRIFFFTAVACSGYGCAFSSTHEKECTANCSDASISDAVRDRLFADASIPDTYISVSTKNGVVYLAGTVGTSVERDAAVAEANQVAGVVHVVNSLEVSGSE